jgi:hydroxycarboxylate dehydrogenase B
VGQDHVVSPHALEEFMGGVCLGMGADPEIAAEVAGHLVKANLSGHDSHGVIRVTQYLAQADKGDLRPAARPSILRESEATALIDAQRGFGQFSTAFALDWALGRASRLGVAVASVRHSMHIGRLGHYTERAGEQGYICLMTVGAAGLGVGGLALYGSRRRFFGANPWSISVPAEGHPPVMFDGSTSMIAEGKVRVARAKGVPLPPGCIMDKDGNPSTNAEDFYAGGALLPLGGEVAAHKGFGLCLTSALLGGLSMIDDPAPTLIGANFTPDGESRGQIAGVFLVVIHPGWFGDGARYQAMVRETVEVAKRVPPAVESSEILMPGEPEVRTRAARQRGGVVLPDATWQDLVKAGARFGIGLPATRSV